MLRQTETPVLGKSREQLPSVGHVALELAASSYTLGETLRGPTMQSLRWITVAEGTTVGKLERIHKHLDSEFPFSVELPADLLTSASVEHVSRRNVEKIVRGWIELVYEVTAKLAVACLSNTDLQQRVAFTIVSPRILEPPLAKSIVIQRTKDIKFMGRGGDDAPCTLRLSLACDHVALPLGPIVADVELDLPANRKTHHVHLVLYEDVSIALEDGTKTASRVVCSKTCKAKQLVRVSGSSTTLRGALELPITNKDESEHGVLVPAFDAAFLHIRVEARLCSARA